MKLFLLFLGLALLCSIVLSAPADTIPVVAQTVNGVPVVAQIVPIQNGKKNKGLLGGLLSNDGALGFVGGLLNSVLGVVGLGNTGSSRAVDDAPPAAAPGAAPQILQAEDFDKFSIMVVPKTEELSQPAQLVVASERK